MVAALHLRSQSQETASLDHHARSRSVYRSRPPEAIELGNEPPLTVGGETSGFVDRRRVSVQWFAGTILTALCGIALMGGAVFTSLDGQTNFASLPERVEVALRGAIGAAGDKLGVPHKGDRLPIAEAPSSTHQVIHVSFVSRQGNHEVMRARPYMLVTGNLSLAAPDYTADIPSFNPQRLLAQSASGGGTADNSLAAQPDAEVSFVMRDLAPMLPKLKIALHTPKDEVLARVKEAAEWSAKTARNLPATTVSITGIKLAYAGTAKDDPYTGAQARVVPENMTLLSKTTNKANDGNPFDEKTITAQKGDTVASILHNLGTTPDEIAAIDKVLGNYGQEDGIQAGDKLRVLLSPIPHSKRLQPVRVIVLDDTVIDAVAALAETGQYVAVAPEAIDNDIVENDHHNSDNNIASNVTLYKSVYETALNDDVPRPIIEDLIRIYSFDIDFDRKVKPGDSFQVLYTDRSKHPSGNRRTDILFAALTVDGQTKKLYRFQTPNDGVIDYYDSTGKSAKKFLLRKPVPEGVMTSGFGLRRHPLLGYVRMHTGVDWAAPIGTPVYAAGKGVIEKEGWDGGYGRFMLLHHANGYETAYGHMSAFAKGTHVGERVRQGQVIGFIGSTGLSTGAHLHFEIRINGHFVDPMRIKLPGGHKLKGPVLASFEEERERLDTLLANKPARVATNIPTGE